MNISEEVEGTLLKRYFPLMLKPIVLTLLFIVIIVWLYFVLFAISPNWFINLDSPQEIREEEIARASNLGSFLGNLFRGNFGYSLLSLRPVGEELALRLPTTLLLIGLSVFFSALIGVGLSFLIRPGKGKPSTFAHSLRGFFWCLAPLIAVSFMLFFGYYFYVWFGFPMFPVRGLYSIPPPTDSIAIVSDMLWHLTLPVATLTFIGLVRILLVVWSSRCAFSGRTPMKKILLPTTTIDFTIFIAAAIIVEWIWTLPGVGRLFMSSLMAADYNALVGAFVIILTLALGLGYVSVFLELLQRVTNLHKDLEKKETLESKIDSAQTKVVAKKYVRMFLGNKSLIIGSVLVGGLLLLALFAPFLTPSDPMAHEQMANSFAMPQWVTIFPQYDNLSTTQESLLYWTVEKGSEFAKGYGAIVTLEYEAKEMETADVELSSRFLYHAVPPKFQCKFNWTAGNVHDVTYSLRLILYTPKGEDYELWSQPPLDINSSRVVFLDSDDPLLKRRLGFELLENIANAIFSQSGEYKILVQIEFRPKSESGKCDITLQDAGFKLLGDVHGILGTDHIGTDVFAQFVYDARATLAVAFLLTFVAVLSGFPLGFVSGYFEGWADNIITPVVEAVLLLPILPIVLVHVFILHAYSGRSWIHYFPIAFPFLLALATLASRNKFLMRPSNQKLKGTTTASKILIGLKDLLANFCLTAISSMTFLISMDFLGFGDPTVPSLGKMLNLAFGFGGFAKLAWWWILPPIVYLSLSALGLLLVGSGLDD